MTLLHAECYECTVQETIQSGLIGFLTLSANKKTKETTYQV